MRASVGDRFWPKVAIAAAEDCWLWTGYATEKGYGRIWNGGGTSRANRCAWELVNGAIPAGMFVLHRCDTPRCVNPEHLFLGTNDDNMRDRDAKNRGARQAGAANGFAKLTEGEVLAIRAAAGRGELQRDIASRFGVSRPHVSAVVRRKLWAHVPAPSGLSS